MGWRMHPPRRGWCGTAGVALCLRRIPSSDGLCAERCCRDRPCGGCAGYGLSRDGLSHLLGNCRRLLWGLVLQDDTAGRSALVSKDTSSLLAESARVASTVNATKLLSSYVYLCYVAASVMRKISSTTMCSKVGVQSTTMHWRTKVSTMIVTDCVCCQCPSCSG